MANYSGLYDGVYGQPYALLSNSDDKGNDILALRHYANRLYGRASIRALLTSLVLGAVGEAATATHKRVQAQRALDENVQGGLRTIETYVEINRNTTTDDRDRLAAALSMRTQPTTYVADRSGNGGGGKLGY